MGAQNLATIKMIQLLQEKIEKIHGAHSIVIRDDDTDPASLFGGTWEKIKGKFLLGAGGGIY